MPCSRPGHALSADVDHGAEPVLAARLAALDHAIRASRLGPIMVPGIHLEGPFLNPTPGYAVVTRPTR